MDYGEWSKNSKGTYNKWDGIACSTTQVYPGEWIAILISVDNVGVWNLRTENLDSWYLGQETYIRVVNPKVSKKTELPMPDNVLYCGARSKKAEGVGVDHSCFPRNSNGGGLLGKVLGLDMNWGEVVNTAGVLGLILFGTNFFSSPALAS
ncbi:hypothetical protein PVK06_045519 [Gossypium arboreum]|uniref:Plastocyanin-like domain-containing protein n=1 Tax=Gossypium arboreum TaxID=29729 RepID=A0ABR0MUA1_GOSAR|nr:hypothetical protein PVK06_045519 [Gossypium arboreum]